jgi:hypothetical protein
MLIRQHLGLFRKKVCALVLVAGSAAAIGQAQTGVDAALLAKAQAGDPQAETSVGLLYDMGQGVQQDPAQAADWYRKAAAQGYALAESNLGALYFNGQGVQQDYAETASW